jgi:hypothetical protein
VDPRSQPLKTKSEIRCRTIRINPISYETIKPLKVARQQALIVD